MWYDIDNNQVEQVSVIDARQLAANAVGYERRPVRLVAMQSDRALSSSKKVERVKTALTFDLSSKKSDKKPEHFRTTTESSKVIRSTKDAKIFKSLGISGSAQFSKKGLETLFKRLKKDFSHKETQLFIIDTRQESHFYLNGAPVSLRGGEQNSANAGKTPQEIRKEERECVKEASKRRKLVVKGRDGKQKEVKVDTAATEDELVQTLDATYVRFPVTDHRLPDRATVDEFISFVQKLPKNHWLHFHCKMGVGRTTIFMTMYQIMKQAKLLSLKDIVAFQKNIGGYLMVKKKKSLSKTARERNKFFENFYKYCKENRDNYETSWSDWYAKKQK